MRKQNTPEQLRENLHRLFESIRSDLDRIEMVAVALNAFNRPIPDYEPNFRHLQHSILNTREPR